MSYPRHAIAEDRRLRAWRRELIRWSVPGWRTVLPLVAVAWGVYFAVLHPWLTNWGTTSAEVERSLPGDELAKGPFFTRAITIDAPPAAVWPWIIQMGQDRAGFYSNTWLENLTGSDIHNADTIHPEWQQRAVGDRVPLARAGLARLGERLANIGHVEIVALERERLIANLPGRFVLERLGDRATRLIFREPIASQGPAVTRWLAWDPMHFVMVQRMLRGIKERAEAKPLVPKGIMVAARIGWATAGLSLVGLLASRGRRWRWLVLAVALVVPALIATTDWDAALAGFIAIGTTMIGALALGRRWWPPFLLIATAVLLILLLAQDAYAAFGLIFDVTAAVVVAMTLARSRISPS